MNDMNDGPAWAHRLAQRALWPISYSYQCNQEVLESPLAAKQMRMSLANKTCNGGLGDKMCTGIEVDHYTL